MISSSQASTTSSLSLSPSKDGGLIFLISTYKLSNFLGMCYIIWMTLGPLNGDLGAVALETTFWGVYSPIYFGYLTIVFSGFSTHGFP
jgi:hypothetical protein